MSCHTFISYYLKTYCIFKQWYILTNVLTLCEYLYFKLRHSSTLHIRGFGVFTRLFLYEKDIQELSLTFSEVHRFFVKYLGPRSNLFHALFKVYLFILCLSGLRKNQRPHFHSQISIHTFLFVFK